MGSPHFRLEAVPWSTSSLRKTISRSILATRLLEWCVKLKGTTRRETAVSVDVVDLSHNHNPWSLDEWYWKRAQRMCWRPGTNRAPQIVQLVAWCTVSAAVLYLVAISAVCWRTAKRHGAQKQTGRFSRLTDDACWGDTFWIKKYRDPFKNILITFLFWFVYVLRCERWLK